MPQPPEKPVYQDSDNYEAPSTSADYQDPMLECVGNNPESFNPTYVRRNDFWREGEYGDHEKHGLYTEESEDMAEALGEFQQLWGDRD